MAHATHFRPAATGGAGGDGEDAFVLSGDSGDSFGVGFSAGHGRVPCGGGGREDVLPHYLKDTMLAAKVKLKGRTICLGKLPKPHRPTFAGTLSDVGSKVAYYTLTAPVCQVVSCLILLAHLTQLAQAVFRRRVIGRRMAAIGSPRLLLSDVECCHWLAMARIIRREVALAPCGGLYYQTLGDR